MAIATSIMVAITGLTALRQCLGDREEHIIVFPLLQSMSYNEEINKLSTGNPYLRIIFSLIVVFNKLTITKLKIKFSDIIKTS